MKVVEVNPLPSGPNPDHAILICSTCEAALEKDRPAPEELRFLESIIWSETTAVQVTAVKLCRKLANQGAEWAAQLLDTVYLSPETEAWLE